MVDKYETTVEFLKENVTPISRGADAEPTKHRESLYSDEIEYFVYKKKTPADAPTPTNKVYILENGHGVLSEKDQETLYYNLTEEQMQTLKMCYI